jgi:hypothetical protein
VRPVVALLSLVALAVGVVGCGGDDPPQRSPAAEELAELCTTARQDIEALGLPAEVGIDVVKPWAARGRILAREVGKLEGATDTEQRQLDTLATQLDAYYKGLRIAFDVYKGTGSSDSYGVAADRATAYLESAEALARGFGVSECAERPFADAPPPG